MDDEVVTYHHRQRSGVNIKGRDLNIDLIVTYFAGSRGKRFGDFEAHGLLTDRVPFSHSAGLTKLVDGIEFEVVDDSEEQVKDTVWVQYTFSPEFTVEYVDNFPTSGYKKAKKRKKPEMRQAESSQTRRPPRPRRPRRTHYDDWSY